MKTIRELIDAFKAGRRARKISALRGEAQHHAEMAEMHGRAAKVYSAQAAELEIAAELAEAGLPEAVESDFSLFDEAARANG